jgi:hypothetical protein
MLADKDNNERIQSGKKVESFIIERLNKSGLALSKASDYDDMLKKVDVWIGKGKEKVGVQIKFRETGSDILFEVYDTFYDFNDSRNKLGRDMTGDAKKYAVLINKKIVIVEKSEAKQVIDDMILDARCNGWKEKTIYHRERGLELQLKLTKDHADGRKKIVAFIPVEYFKSSQMISL